MTMRVARRVLVVIALWLVTAGAVWPGDRAASGSCTAELVSARFGFAVCGSRVLFSTDGRRAWRSVTSPRLTGPIHDAVFLRDALHGWVVTNECAAGEAFLHRTADGGRRWASTAVGATNCSAGSRLELSFLDRRHGSLTRVFANGAAALLQTTGDGGVTWSGPRELPFVGSVVFRTPAEGWIGRSDVARPQGLAVTRDGGRTWRRRVLTPPAGWHGARLFPNRPTFFGARGVLPVALAQERRSGVAFYVTGDRGRTWRLRSVRTVGMPVLVGGNPFVRYVPTSIAAPSTWWMVGGRLGQEVQLTRDGGRQWSVAMPRAGRLGAVSAVDRRRAWVTGAALLATADGGRSWHRLEPARRGRAR